MSNLDKGENYEWLSHTVAFSNLSQYYLIISWADRVIIACGQNGKLDVRIRDKHEFMTYNLPLINHLNFPRRIVAFILFHFWGNTWLMLVFTS